MDSTTTNRALGSLQHFSISVRGEQLGLLRTAAPAAEPAGRPPAGVVALGDADAGQQQLPVKQQQQVEPLQHSHSRSSNRRHQRGAEAVAFQGDVAEWGRTRVDGFYGADDGASSTAADTLSSGVSPRESRPRGAPFDADAAQQTFAYQAGMFSRAQALRRDGRAPASMGLPDDLPTRLAVSQLDALAGMASKVHDAILHNKRMFECRLMSEGRGLLRRALHGWLGRVKTVAAKYSRLLRAQARLRRGTLLRAYFSWKNELHHADKTLAMTRKVAAVTAAGCVRRCFAAWLKLAGERWWKLALAGLERQIGAMEAQARNHEKRPILVLRKRRLDQLLSAWLVEALWGRHKRQQLARAVRWCRRRQQQRAWGAWRAHVAARVRERALTSKLQQRHRQVQVAAAWQAWQLATELLQQQRQQLAAAVQHRQQQLCSCAWRAWAARRRLHATKRLAEGRWRLPLLARAFRSWQALTARQAQQRLLLKRAAARRQLRLVVSCFAGWQERVEGKKLEAQLDQQRSLQDQLAAAAAECARLRRDNERFVRLVDSGEWGRGRVAELASAGEVLRAERDALLALMGALRREHEAAAAAREGAAGELQAIKDRMSVKGAARNHLLVKGGSSFNGLVRALKQDLLDTGAGTKNPGLLFQIDKLSLDHVTVCPDGELRVDAVVTRPPMAAGAKQQRSALGQQQQQQQGSPLRARASPPGAVTSSSQPGSPAHAAAGPAQAGQRGVGAAAAASRRVGKGSSGSSAAPTTDGLLQALSGLSSADVAKLQVAGARPGSASLTRALAATLAATAPAAAGADAGAAMRRLSSSRGASARRH